MTRRYGRIPKIKYAATLNGVTAYQPMTMKAMRPGVYPAPGQDGAHPMEPKGPKGMPSGAPKSKEGKGEYCYVPQKNALIAKGRPAITGVKYLGDGVKNGVHLARVFVPGKNTEMLAPFCDQSQEHNESPRPPGPMPIPHGERPAPLPYPPKKKKKARRRRRRG